MVNKEFMLKVEIFQWMGDYWMKVDKFKTDDPFVALARINKYCSLNIFNNSVENFRDKLDSVFNKI